MAPKENSPMLEVARQVAEAQSPKAIGQLLTDLAKFDAAMAAQAPTAPSDRRLAHDTMPTHEGMPEGWRWLLVAFLWGVYAFSFGFEAVVNFGEWWLGRGSQYLALTGLDAATSAVLGVSGLIFWKGRGVLPAKFIKTLTEAASNAFVWIAILLVLFVVLGLPSMLDRIGVASNGTSVAQSPSTNPLHDNGRKWLAEQALAQGDTAIGAPCIALINHYQTPYSEAVTHDLEEVLEAAHWKHPESFFATREIPKGITFRANDEAGYKCAELMRRSLADALSTSLPPPDRLPKQPGPVDPNSYLWCGGCFEIRIGNEPGQ